MSSRSPQSRRTYAGSRSWSLDHHQRPMHVLRSRCHGSVPFDPASPLGKERMVRAVPRDRAGSLAATIADFCNKICQKLTYAVQRRTQLFDHLIGEREQLIGHGEAESLRRLARFHIAIEQPNPSRLVGARRPGFHPGLDERARLLLRAGGRLPAISGRPGPTNQSIAADVMDERFQWSPAIARGVLDLCADLSERFTFPCHLARCKLPLRIARHAGGIEVGLLVADRTTHGW